MEDGSGPPVMIPAGVGFFHVPIGPYHCFFLGGGLKISDCIGDIWGGGHGTMGSWGWFSGVGGA